MNLQLRIAIVVALGSLLLAGCSGSSGNNDSGIADADADGMQTGDDGGLDAADDQADAGDDGGSLDGDAGDGQQPQPCQLDFDCPSGQVCKLGFCQPFEPECSIDDDCPGDEVCREGICLESNLSPDFGTFVFNEVLTDGNTDGDPNGDGSRDGVEDEFVELVNVSNRTIDLSGWTLTETDWDVHLARHTFAAGVQADPLVAVVVFGGGEPPDSTDTVTYLAANAQDPGTQYGLDLDDAGDLVVLRDAAGLTVAVFAYGDEGGTPAVSDESATRDPDLTGDFTAHTQADGAQSAIFSPGTRVDGTAF
ncbi:MAG: lamin tail domain-containing protein [Deltaproteobacteria bacterium]|nr:lamin tail domain-containing protein [Deltaproteobacteria bacterium]